MRTYFRGFTLVELTVSTAVIAGLILILATVVGQTNAIWRRTTGKIEEFQSARDAFDLITTRISEATLNTYWDYNSTTAPTSYQRRSELRFFCGHASNLLGTFTGPNGTQMTRVTHCVFFHSLLGIVDGSQGAAGANASYGGLTGLLNAWGYYVELNSDAANRPAFFATATNAPPLKYRFRLMEFRQSSEELSTYNYTSGMDPSVPGRAAAIGYHGADWFQTPLNSTTPPCRVVADNIVALILMPRLSKEDEQALPAGMTSSNPDFSPLAPNYTYDSSQTSTPGQTVISPLTNPQGQLPPVLQVTLVAIDEASAVRLNLNANSANFFNVNGKFLQTTQYASDLSLSTLGATASLENTLVARKLNYRVFTTNVPIHAAKWSRDEVN